MSDRIAFLKRDIQFCKDNRNKCAHHFRNTNWTDATENRRLWQLEMTLSISALRRAVKDAKCHSTT